MSNKLVGMKVVKITLKSDDFLNIIDSEKVILKQNADLIYFEKLRNRARLLGRLTNSLKYSFSLKNGTNCQTTFKLVK